MSITHKYVFVDLDECLFHTGVRYGSKPAEGEVTGDFGDGVLYCSTLRPGAKDLLAGLRMIVGDLYVLTSSVEAYARHFTKEFGFGFDESKIFTREDLQSGSGLSPEAFPNGRAYLIDNLPRHENRIKVQFLRPIDPDLTYINVTEYWGRPDQGFTPTEIRNILDIVRK
jgi:hypothetical protein